MVRAALVMATVGIVGAQRVIPSEARNLQSPRTHERQFGPSRTLRLPRVAPLLILSEAKDRADNINEGPDGAKLYATTCAACHQPTGVGIEEKYPPLAGSEWAQGSEERMLRIVLQGLNGEVEVAGTTFSGAMPGWGAVLKDDEIAAVVSYVRSAWGNKAAPVSAATVTRIRAATAERKVPWTVAELSAIRK